MPIPRRRVFSTIARSARQVPSLAVFTKIAAANLAVPKDLFDRAQGATPAWMPVLISLPFWASPSCLFQRPGRSPMIPGTVSRVCDASANTEAVGQVVPAFGVLSGRLLLREIGLSLGSGKGFTADLVLFVAALGFAEARLIHASKAIPGDGRWPYDR